MIFNLIKWSVILKAVLKLKPYFRVIAFLVTALVVVSFISGEAVYFLKDTNQVQLIAPVYFIKWGLVVSILLLAYFYFKKITKSVQPRADEPRKPPPEPKKHHEILTKGKLMSKGDKILKR